AGRPWAPRVAKGVGDGTCLHVVMPLRIPAWADVVRVASGALEEFRNREDVTLAFAPGVTALVGPNGAGKTNILEAIHLVARGESSRASDDAEMIRWGHEFARVAVEIDRGTDRTRLDVTFFAPAAGARRRPRRDTAD